MQWEFQNFLMGNFYQIRSKKKVNFVHIHMQTSNLTKRQLFLRKYIFQHRFLNYGNNTCTDYPPLLRNFQAKHK